MMDVEPKNQPTKPSLATVWLDGCSGCHMSFLDLDEQLVDIVTRADLVYSPLVDNKLFPEHVDVTLVEGAVSSQEDFEKIQHIRAHTKILVSLGDCAVTANVPSMRNPFGARAILQRAYVENVTLNPQIPVQVVPPLLKRVRPVHEVVKVDVFVPGCPPSAATIGYVVNELLEGRVPDLTGRTRFGA
jgi:NAD-reducing hydrogenase small subunit